MKFKTDALIYLCVMQERVQKFVQLSSTLIIFIEIFLIFSKKNYNEKMLNFYFKKKSDDSSNTCPPPCSRETMHAQHFGAFVCIMRME